jgi:hypothetical protein
MNLKNTGFLVLALFIGLFTSKVWAQDDDNNADYIKSRTYIGVLGTSSTIDQWGDFNGQETLTMGATQVQTTPVTIYSDEEQTIIPSIGRNFGFGALLGHREGPWAAEISFWRSDHTASWTGGGSVTFTTPASLQSVNIDFKRYFFTELPTQPFILMGMSFPWLWVRQASTLIDINSGTPVAVMSNDATMSGLGLNLGAGLEIYVGDGFSILGGVEQRWTGFNQTNGAAKIGNNSIYFDGNPKDVGSLEGDGLNLYVGTTIGIP